MLKPLLAIAALVSVAEHAAACRGPMWEHSTILRDLPPKAHEQPVVARIQILEVLKPQGDFVKENWRHSDRVRVRVTEGIKGVHDGQIFLVDTGGTSCGQLIRREAVEALNSGPLFIAGGFEKSHTGEPIFRGSWGWNDERKR
jgi:hypothetical protein